MLFNSMVENRHAGDFFGYDQCIGWPDERPKCNKELFE